MILKVSGLVGILSSKHRENSMTIVIEYILGETQPTPHSWPQSWPSIYRRMSSSASNDFQRDCNFHLIQDVVFQPGIHDRDSLVQRQMMQIQSPAARIIITTATSVNTKSNAYYTI